MDSMKPLSPETAAKIDALAQQISVAHQLDAEIQAELRGHIEDKLRGYVRGEVKVSEADALLLAKAHFGDARLVKDMLAGVHGEAHAGSLARRLVAVFVATMAVLMVGAIVDIAWQVSVGTLAYFAARNEYSPLFPDVLLALLIAAVEAGLLWAILSIWRRQQQRGVRLWFDKWGSLPLGAVIAVTMIGEYLIAHSRAVELLALRGKEPPMFAMPARPIELIVTVWGIVCVSYAVKAVLWIWWSNRTSLSWRVIAAAFVSWLVTTQVLALIYGVSGLLAQGFWRPSGIMNIIRLVQPSRLLDLQVEALMGMLAVIVYVGTTRARRIGVSD